jgi:hypothetical protein
MFGMVDAYAPGVSPAKGSGFTGDVMPVKLLVQPQRTTVSGVFVAPVAGRYQFVLHGAGAGSGVSPGGPGALAARVVRLRRAQEIPYVVSAAYNVTPVNSTVTFPDRVMTAGPGANGGDDGSGNGIGGNGGTASGGDVNINGAVAHEHYPSSQAPSYGAFIGGTTSGSAGTVAGAPGAPGPSFGTPGAPGQLAVIYIGP